MKGEWKGGKGSANRTSDYKNWNLKHDKIYASKLPSEWAELLGHKIVGSIDTGVNINEPIKYAEYLQAFLIEENG